MQEASNKYFNNQYSIFKPFADEQCLAIGILNLDIVCILCHGNCFLYKQTGPERINKTTMAKSLRG